MITVKNDDAASSVARTLFLHFRIYEDTRSHQNVASDANAQIDEPMDGRDPHNPKFSRLDLGSP